MLYERTFRFAVWIPFILLASQFLLTHTQDDCPGCQLPGSDNKCDSETHLCICLPGYQGDNCTICKEDYFRYNESLPCEPCQCNSTGVVNNTCDRYGRCNCADGVTGDKCTSCEDGYYNLTTDGCSLCQCNGHATLCDKLTGICHDCANNTSSDDCSQCQPFYYRDYNKTSEDSCEKCPCSEHSSTQTCHYDEHFNNNTGDVVCDSCKLNYTGQFCNECDDNFYMSNTTLKVCTACDCNDNVILNQTGNCDSLTGECLKCVFNTTGDHCEECLPGYHGDPIYHKNCTGPDYKPDKPTTANSTINVITIIVVIALVVICMIAGSVFYMYRRKHYRKTPLPFWTIELRKDDSMSFNDYHNLDSSLIDDVMVAPRGQLRMGDTSNYDTINT
ncbi:multiple epidermal growth factor-like domains protein 9 [Saccoglossus kowalevskii]